MKFLFGSLVLGTILVSSMSMAIQEAPKFLDLSRRPKVLTGTIIIKNDWPFFQTDGKQYKIETCDAICKEQVDNCKDGERCEIRAEVRGGANPTVVVKSLRVIGVVGAVGETKTTRSGHVFVRDYSYPELGEAWRDESGMIWGSVVRNHDGSFKPMTHSSAEAYCNGIGAALPSGWLEEINGKYGFPNRDSDFTRLRKYMGAEPVTNYEVPRGYKPQVLPDLEASRWNWSLSIHNNAPYLAFMFHGPSSSSSFYDRNNDLYFRCVARVH